MTTAFASNGGRAGLEILYDQKWVWYRDVRITNFGPAAILHFEGIGTGCWACLLHGRSWYRESLPGRVPARPGWNSHLSTVHGAGIFASGAENFGTLDQVLFRASRSTGSGLKVRLAPGQEIGALIGYQWIAGGRSQIGTGVTVCHSLLKWPELEWSGWAHPLRC